MRDGHVMDEGCQASAESRASPQRALQRTKEGMFGVVFEMGFNAQETSCEVAFFVYLYWWYLIFISFKQKVTPFTGSLN